MCGRFVLTDCEKKIMNAFNVSQSEINLKPRYNICPSQIIPVIVQQNSFRSLKMMKWGLIPFWSKEPKPMINARSETAAEKPTFRQALRNRRCLIPTNGFFEWTKEGGQKQPYLICLKNKIPMAFAGLWEEWISNEGKIYTTCAILTIGANTFMEEIHPRMPVILTQESWVMWLDSSTDSAEKLLLSSPPEQMEAWKVSRKVNDPTFDNPNCIKKID